MGNSQIKQNQNKVEINTSGESQGDDPLKPLPTHVISFIFSFIAPEELPIFVCKKWYAYGLEPALWDLYFKQYLPEQLSTIQNRSMPDIKNAFLKVYFKVDPRRKIMNLTKTLLEMGYPVQLSAGYSASGCYFRVRLTNGKEEVYDSFGSGNEIFKISKPCEMSDKELAKAFIAKYNFKKRSPDKSELIFQKWFLKVYSKLSIWDSYHEYADWYEKPTKLPIDCNCRTRPCTSSRDLPFFNDISDSHPFIKN